MKEKLPKYSIIENVKNLVSKRFKEQFDMILKDLEDLGYTNYWQILNSKDYGIPQNRERVFIISIRNDIARNNFTFPTKIPLGWKLKDFLEENVDEKYYLTENGIGRLIKKNNISYPNNISKRGRVGKETSHTILTSPNMAVLQKNNNIKMFNLYNNKEIKDIAPTQTTTCGCTTSSSAVLISEDGEYCFKIRKLTPLECWRLMGFYDEDFNKAKSVGISDTQLYIQAGNSIVVNVLEFLFKELIKENEDILSKCA